MTPAPELEGPARDFDLFGLLRVRAESANERQLARIAHQLGVEPRRSSGRADLTISFAPATTEGRPLAMAGPDAGAVDGSFVIVDGGARTAIPFDALGRGTVIRCDPGVTSVPHLIPLVNALFLGIGVLPLHASTADLNGQGIATAGWSKGGKTEALLALMSAGAAPVADEWTYVEPASRVAHGALGPVRLTAEHLSERPELRRLVGARRRARMSVAGAGLRAYRGILTRSWRRVPAFGWLHRFVGLLETASGADLGLAALGAEGGMRTVRLRQIVLVMASEGPETSLSTIDAPTAVERMVAAHMHHRRALLDRYETFRFCFPERRSELIETLETRERALLAELFGEDEVPVVTHPHPASIGQLRATLLRALDDG
jgi:hypothetical protein